jgi:hypothetical protein
MPPDSFIAQEIIVISATASCLKFLVFVEKRAHIGPMRLRRAATTRITTNDIIIKTFL